MMTYCIEGGKEPIGVYVPRYGDGILVERWDGEPLAPEDRQALQILFFERAQGNA